MVKTVTYEDLIGVPITYEGSKYAPVHHIEVIKVIREEIKRQGFTIYKEEYKASKNKQQLIGKFILEWPDIEIRPMVTFKNSLDGSVSFGVVAGTVNFVCLNGQIYGDAFQYKRKHTGDAHQDILENTRLAVESIPAVLEFHKAFIQQLKSVPVYQLRAAEFCGLMFFDDILNTEQLNIVREQFKLPAHDYGHPNTAWEFYNHCTYALKDAHPLTWHKKHKELSEFFLNFVLDNPYNDEEE